MVARRAELERSLAAEDATRNLERFRNSSREHAELSTIAALYEDYRKAEGDAEAARELELGEELKDARAAMERLEAELQKALLPRDPNDERNIFLEIRAGTGGDESALFAADLFRMYTRYAERHGWQAEVISESPSELGGYKEVIAKIVGQGAYSRLKFESGGHRVQRVPQGRVTDHRINLRLYKIDRIMDGELDELIGALSAEQQAEQLAQLSEEAA